MYKIIFRVIVVALAGVIASCTPEPEVSCLEPKAECLKFILDAAAEGNSTAQYNLGVMYYSGEEIGKDTGEAVRWFRMAAKLGNAKAQFNLGAMYLSGVGVRKNRIEAYIWFLIARENGGAESNILSKTARKLSSKQIKIATQEVKKRIAAIKLHKKLSVKPPKEAQPETETQGTIQKFFNDIVDFVKNLFVF